jgi:YidC/Oxa1 family membrane protein insertase
MSKFFGVPVHAAYYVVTALAGAITPLAGGLAVALAIVVFTIAVRLLLLPFSFYALRGQVTQSRLAPQIQALRQRHRKDPDRMTREVRALYRAEGTSMFAGYLPLLLQWPFLSVMYLLFRSGTVSGAPNSLLRHHLFGAELGAHWLSGAGPLSLPGVVFAGLFALLALTGYVSVRINRRLFPRPAPAPSTTAKRPAGRNTPPPATPAPPPSWLANVLPLLTVCFAAFLPLAGGLYLLTTTAWTLLERRVLAHYLLPAAPAPAVKPSAAVG